MTGGVSSQRSGERLVHPFHREPLRIFTLSHKCEINGKSALLTAGLTPLLFTRHSAAWVNLYWIMWFSPSWNFYHFSPPILSLNPETFSPLSQTQRGAILLSEVTMELAAFVGIKAKVWYKEMISILYVQYLLFTTFPTQKEAKNCTFFVSHHYEN